MSRVIIPGVGGILSAAFLALLTVLLLPTLAALHHRWMSGAIEYGYLVVAMAMFVAYRRLVSEPISIGRGSGFWLLAFVAILAIIFVSELVGIGLIPQLVFPLVVFVAAGLVAGEEIARRLLLPLLFLYFTIPFWQGLEYVGLSGFPLNETLRQMTVIAVTAAVGMTGIPAFIDGDFIVLPTGVIEIAEGCSGRAYFITALELSAFYALAFLKSARYRIMLIVIASSQALLGNWIRVLALTMIGYFSEMQHPLVEDHADFGWVVFCVTTLPFVFIGRWLEGKEDASSPTSLKLSVASIMFKPNRWVAIAISCVCAVLIAEAGLRYVGSRVAPLDWQATELATSRACLGPWPEESRPFYPAAASSWSAACSIAGQSVAVFVADYPFQTQGREAIHFDNQPAPGRDIQRRGTEIIDAPTDYQTLRFSAFESGSDRNRAVTWVAYRVSGGIATGNLDAKLLQLKGILKGRYDAQVYVLTAECRDDCSTASTILRHIVSEHSEDIFADRRNR